MRKYNLNENFFDELNEKSAYWLGFLYADGYVSSYENSIGISLKSEDINHLEKFKNFLNSINNFGGIYKYRWGDYEIINLFLYMFYEKPIMNFNFSDSVYKSAHPDTKQVNDQINFCSRLLFFVTRRLRRLFNY